MSSGAERVNAMRPNATRFIERGEITEIALRSVFKTKEQRDEVVERYGVIEGGHQTLGRLAAYAVELGAKAGSP